MGAPKIIPIEIKKAKGTYRKDRDRHPPPASEGKPWPPKWLNTVAKQKFHLMRKRLDHLGIASATYTETIALLASRLEEVERYTKQLEDEGDCFECTARDGTTFYKPHPATNLRERAMNHSHKLLVEFGLTASSIQRIGRGKKEEKKKNPFER
jgi:P27 family predicted phage terminase small subunit